MPPPPRRLAALALALLAAARAAAGVALPGFRSSPTPPPSPSPPNPPAPGCAPPPPPSAGGNIALGLLITGLSNYTLPVQGALQAAVASVASSAVPNVTVFPAQDVSVNVTSYAAYAAVTLQGAALLHLFDAPAGARARGRAALAAWIRTLLTATLFYRSQAFR